MALGGAGAAVAALALTWYVSHRVGFLMRADVSVLQGFAQLNRPRLDTVTNFIASLCSPNQYVVLAALPILLALARRRPRVAVMLALIIVGANETTQLLKPLLAAPRDPVWWDPINDASWPSGHATAAMSLALCAVIAAPARRRPAVAAAMSAFAIAVCYSFLELGWHYPSDVFGGFLVASTWTLLGMAGLWTYEAHRPGVAATARRRGGSVPGEARPAQFSIAEALAPVVAVLGTAAVFAGLIVLARPHQVINYARAHETFVVGAAGIGVLGLMLASGVSVMLRRG
jgi:membrane-associated phospholipid phosphatase